MVIPESKYTVVSDAEKQVITSQQQYLDGAITNGERNNKVTQLWSPVHREGRRRDVRQHEEGRQGRSHEPDLHHGRLRARGSKSRFVSSPVCVVSWPSPPAKSSRRPSRRTSAKASPCCSTSSRRTAPVRVLLTPRSRRLTRLPRPAVSSTCRAGRHHLGARLRHR